MNRKVILILILLITKLSVFSQKDFSLLNDDDLKYLKELTADVIESSQISAGQSVSPDFGHNSTGGVLIRPGGRDCYPAFWIRDYAMSLDCGLIKEKDQLHMLRLTASTQCDQTWITKGGSMVPFGAIADHIRIDNSLPIYYPGTYSYEDQGSDMWGKTPPYSDQFFFINMAYHYVITSGKTDILLESINNFKLIERLEWAFRVPPSHKENHIVYTTEHFRGVDFGFRDAQVITGDLSITSIFKYRAAKEMAELCKLLGESSKTLFYESVADKLKTSIPQIFCDARGMIMASTGISKQADVWATALAVYYGILEKDMLRKTSSALAKAYQDGTLAYKGNIRHVLTSDDYNEVTSWERSFTEKNSYQNGAYWGTPTGWVCYAIAQTDPKSAKALATEYIEDLKKTDYRKGDSFGGPFECFNKKGDVQNPVYLTTVSCPLSVFMNRVHK